MPHYRKQGSLEETFHLCLIHQNFYRENVQGIFGIQRVLYLLEKDIKDSVPFGMNEMLRTSELLFSFSSSSEEGAVNVFCSSLRCR